MDGHFIRLKDGTITHLPLNVTREKPLLGSLNFFIGRRELTKAQRVRWTIDYLSTCESVGRYSLLLSCCGVFTCFFQLVWQMDGNNSI